MSISIKFSDSNLDDNSNLNSPLIKEHRKSYWGGVRQKLTSSGEKIKQWASGFYTSVIEPCSRLKDFCASEETLSRRVKNELIRSLPIYKFYQGNIVNTYRIYESFRTRDTSTQLDEAFESMKKLNLLDDWMKLKSYSDLETAKRKQQLELAEGLCFGYSAAVIDLMPKFGHLDSEKLVAKLKFEDIYLFQFFSKHKICEVVCNRNKLQHLNLILGDFSNSIDSQDKNVIAQIANPYFLFFFIMKHLQKLSFNFDGVYYKSFTYNRITSNFEDQREYFTKAITSFQKGVKEKQELCLGNKKIDSGTERVLCGFIILEENEERYSQRVEKSDTQANTPLKIDGHVLFFQFDQYHYRFQDSGLELPGFFDFSNEEEFFKGLTQHLQTLNPYIKGKLAITLLSMPKEEVEVPKR